MKDEGITERRLMRLKSVAAKRQTDLAVVLENVHDMHNVGAVLRTCDATGIQSVFLLLNDPDIEIKNFTLGKRTSSGARKWVDVYIYRDTEACLKDLRSRYDQLLATGMEAGDAQDLFDLDLTTSSAIIFGNEHSGLSEAMVRAADHCFTIPQIGMTRSLNISVACAVTLYESMRQRISKGMISGDTVPGKKAQKELFEEFKNRHYLDYSGKYPFWPEEDE